MNNHGHVTFSAYKQKEVGKETWGERSFLWIDGLFKMIMPEKNWETSVRTTSLDDDGNMIISTYPQIGGAHSYYFISPYKNIFILCQQGYDYILKNGLPIAKDCLPGQLKKSNQDKLYYSTGMQIKKLFKEEYPYYNVANTTEIQDQNSKGLVVGQISTMFPGRSSHAFLAIPEQWKESE